MPRPALCRLHAVRESRESLVPLSHVTGHNRQMAKNSVRQGKISLTVQPTTGLVCITVVPR